jgi:hypothetical protein
VLYTVQQYMNHVSCVATKEQIQECLGPLIRCQHLSHYWLHLSASSRSAASMPLGQLQPQVKQLLTLRIAVPSATPAELHNMVPDASSSWALGQRSTIPVSRVELEWELDISTLREAAKRSAAEQEEQCMASPSVTPPP